MPDLWPFSPDHRITERLTWQTDVIKTATTEMRFAAREVRQELGFNFRFNATEATKAEGLIEANALGDWHVPLWHQVSRGGNVGSGDSVITCDTDGSFDATGKILIWQDLDNYVLADISSLGAGTVTITGTVGANLTNPAILPVRDGIAPAGLHTRRTFADEVDAAVNFVMRSADETAANPYGTYLSAPVVPDASKVVQALAGRIGQPQRAVGSGVGLLTVERTRDVLEGLYAWNHQDESLADRKTWRQWLNHLRGRDTEFWLSRRSRDFISAAPIAAIDTEITVAPVYTTLAEYIGRDISISDGTNFVYRNITNAVANGSNVDLSIAATGQAYTDPEISLLRKYRLGADAVTIQHTAERSFCDLIIEET